VLDDLAGHPLVPDLHLDRLAGIPQILADLRESQRLAVQIRRLDGLRDEADLLAPDDDLAA
jgi:hypothetical protein